MLEQDKYTERAITNQCDAEIQHPATFYRLQSVNYRGCCLDTGRFYTEFIADYLINNLDTFKNGFRLNRREPSYYIPSHQGQYDETSNRTEEHTAIKMYRYCKEGHEYPAIGRILDYQIPLKNKRIDPVGKIDLIAYNPNDNTLRLLELKRQDTQETMLRCVLEAYTYLRTVDVGKLINDFNTGAGMNLPPDAHIHACPLVYENSLPHREYLDLEHRPQLRRLMKQLASVPIIYREMADGYEIL